MQEAVVNMIKSKIAHGKFGEVYFVYGLRKGTTCRHSDWMAGVVTFCTFAFELKNIVTMSSWQDKATVFRFQL